MVNTLSGSVSAYRKEIVKPRFIRIDEVMALLDVTRDEATQSPSLLRRRDVKWILRYTQGIQIDFSRLVL